MRVQPLLLLLLLLGQERGDIVDCHLSICIRHGNGWSHSGACGNAKISVMVPFRAVVGGGHRADNEICVWERGVVAGVCNNLKNANNCSVAINSI
jgi:hypothetical protein